jgi:dTDP-4-amino-4,6-dideoxygalactose transaminase
VAEKIMYFVHPQIKIEAKNLKKVFKSFFEKRDFEFLKKKLSAYFPEKNFVFTDMGRSAFKIIVEKLNLKNSQILLPAFICDIFYPVLKEYNIEPIFLDIDLKTFHIKIQDIPQKITPKTKAILICHTFGLPLDFEKLYFLLRTSNFQIPIIEDCAHSFFAKYKEIPVGNLGTVSFFSLYKQFPIARGGLLIFPKEWKIELPKTKFNFRDFISLLNSFSPFAFLFKKFGKEIAPKMMKKEKSKEPVGINDVSLNIFSQFLEDFEKNLAKRIELAKFYQKELKSLGFEVQEGEGNVFCYLSALIPKECTEKRDQFVVLMRKYNIFCTRIWKDPIILNKNVQKDYKINLADFPNTIETAKRIVNFPLQNYFEEKDIKKIISATKEVLLKLKG